MTRAGGSTVEESLSPAPDSGTDPCPNGGDHVYRFRRAAQAYMDAVVAGQFSAYPWHIFPEGAPWQDGWYCQSCLHKRAEDGEVPGSYFCQCRACCVLRFGDR